MEWYNRSWAVSWEVKHTHDPAIPHPDASLREIRAYVHPEHTDSGSLIWKSRTLDTTEVSSNRWMEKDITVYLCNGTRLNAIEECPMDVRQIEWLKRRCRGTEDRQKDDTRYDSIYRKFWKMQTNL